MKCEHCPLLKEDVACRGERTSRLCELVKVDKSYEAVLKEKNPTLLDKVAHFVPAVVNHAIDKFKNVSPSVQAARLAICNKCEHLSIDGQRECLVCGCSVDKKTEWASEECPIGLWPTDVPGKAPSVPPEATKKAAPSRIPPRRNGCCGGSQAGN